MPILVYVCETFLLPLSCNFVSELVWTPSTTEALPKSVPLLSICSMSV